MEDGGWWNYLAGLVLKHGVVPLSAMPETNTSKNTRTFNEIIGRMMRVYAVRIVKLHGAGANIAELRAQKAAAEKDLYRFQCINLGKPPKHFEWRFRQRKDPAKSGDAASAELLVVEEKDASGTERHTPQSFCEKYVASFLAEFVCLYNDPHNELDRHYSFDRARSIVGSACTNFVNIAPGQMKEIAKASILANEPLWFAVNWDFAQSPEHGLMDDKLFDYETLFGIDLTVSKADRTRFHAGASGHAVVLVGVDLDSEGNPRKWLAENSHGTDPCEKCFWSLSDSWFDEHVYTIIAHRRHVPAEILARFKEKPTVLPAWYPGAERIRS